MLVSSGTCDYRGAFFMTNPLISIGQLLNKPQGTTDRHRNISIEAKFDDVPEINPIAPIVFDLDVIKLSHEFTAYIKNLTCECTFVCSRCLVPFVTPLIIAEASRQYIYDLPTEDIPNDEEVFHIQKGASVIDIRPFLREEIVLHFPDFPVCSDSCKGLCSACGINLNLSECTCKKGSANNPFSALKL